MGLHFFIIRLIENSPTQNDSTPIHIKYHKLLVLFNTNIYYLLFILENNLYATLQ